MPALCWESSRPTFQRLSYVKPNTQLMGGNHFGGAAQKDPSVSGIDSVLAEESSRGWGKRPRQRGSPGGASGGGVGEAFIERAARGDTGGSRREVVCLASSRRNTGCCVGSVATGRTQESWTFC